MRFFLRLYAELTPNSPAMSPEAGVTHEAISDYFVGGKNASPVLLPKTGGFLKVDGNEK